jgi:hypothetical protein
MTLNGGFANKSGSKQAKVRHTVRFFTFTQRFAMRQQLGTQFATVNGFLT